MILDHTGKSSPARRPRSQIPAVNPGILHPLITDVIHMDLFRRIILQPFHFQSKRQPPALFQRLLPEQIKIQFPGQGRQIFFQLSLPVFYVSHLCPPDSGPRFPAPNSYNTNMFFRFLPSLAAAKASSYSSRAYVAETILSIFRTPACTSFMHFLYWVRLARQLPVRTSCL